MKDKVREDVRECKSVGRFTRQTVDMNLKLVSSSNRQGVFSNGICVSKIRGCNEKSMDRKKGRKEGRKVVHYREEDYIKDRANMSEEVFENLVRRKINLPL